MSLLRRFFGWSTNPDYALYSESHNREFKADLGISINLKSADKELKAVTPEKSKTSVTAFIKMLVTTFQLSRTRKGHFFLK